MNSMSAAARMYRNCHKHGTFFALVSLGVGGIWSTSALAADEPAAGVLQEVVVTATRREESLSKVPISVSAFTQESIDIRGIKDFQDVARFTPGVNIDNTGTNNISIRGITSTAGAGTTGIYIDDTPIQMRALAFNPDDALPKTFDVERVEVLRGPQGTLFGAGSEGGTVRYITTQPSLTKFTAAARSPTRRAGRRAMKWVSRGVRRWSMENSECVPRSGTGGTEAGSTTSIRPPCRPSSTMRTTPGRPWSGLRRSGRPPMR